MSVFRLPRTGLPELQFTGHQLVKIDGRDDATGSACDRRHNLAIYKTDDGEFIVSASYRSPHPGEVQDDYVEAVSSISEVEEILSLYNPTERIDCKSFDEPGRLQRVKQALLRDYDRQVAAVLKSVPQETVNP